MQTRADGRDNGSLRPLHVECGVLQRPDGSCRLRLGDSEVLAAAYGPIAEPQSRLELPDRARVQVHVHWQPPADVDTATMSLGSREGEQQSLRHPEAEALLEGALETAILVRRFPRKLVKISAQVISDDGSMIACALLACAAAIVDAGIEMSQMPSAACCVVNSNGVVLLDPTKAEERAEDAMVVFACTLADDDERIATLQVDGALTKEMLKKTLTSAIAGARASRSFLRLAFLESNKVS